MKNLIILFIFLCPTLSFAQNKFEPQVKVSYELGVDEDSNQSFGGEFLAGYRITNNFRLGLGLGIYWCKHLYEEKLLDDYRETASYIPPNSR